MTKKIKTVLSVAVLVSAAISAQSENVVMHTPEGFQVMAVSPNGKWACGVFVDATTNVYAFRWNLEGGSIEMLGGQISVAMDVANDGTVSGEFGDREYEAGYKIDLPGYWRDGKWHHLQMPAGTVITGIGAGISPDGQYMTGSLELDGIYTPFIWKNGQIHRNLATGNNAVAYAVSPDGQSAAGYSTRHNRTVCYWGPDGSTTYFADSPDFSESPWNYARNFSPDGTKLLYWGGWEIDAETDDLYLYAVCDLLTGQRKKVKSPTYDSELEFFDISNNDVIVGSSNGRGYFAVDCEGMFVDDYLAMRGVDLSDFDDFYNGGDYYVDQLPIYRVVSLNEDASVIAMHYYDKLGQPSSMVVKIGVDVANAKPAEVSGAQLPGLNTVALKWKRPVGVSGIRGYNVYRDGKKINGVLTISVPYFYDKNLAAGTYSYEVSAVTVAGVETRAEAFTVEVADEQPQQPWNLMARQIGSNGAMLCWDKPFTNIVHRRYYNRDEKNLDGFSIYTPIEVEMAVKFDKAEMANYAGCQISEVSFIPMDRHSNWAINIYTRDNANNLQLIASQPVTQKLTYKSINTVQLDQAVDLPDGDLIVAVEVMVNPEYEYVIGTEAGSMATGYSDLLRQKAEPDFYSTFEASTSTGLYVSTLSWGIDVGLKQPGETSMVKNMLLYVDDAAAIEIEPGATEHIIDAMTEGTHTLALEAVYTDGAVSGRVNTSVDIRNNYPKIEIDKLEIGGEKGNVVTAHWNKTENNDLTNISYSNAGTHTYGVKGVENNGYAMMAASAYTSTMLEGYAGYVVRSFTFYPLADALFTFMLYKDEELVCELEVDDFEIGKWNEVMLDQELTIEKYCDYRLVLDCFDPEPDKSVLALDNRRPHEFLSDLYSIDNGATWGSLSVETSLYGNWMMGMHIAAPQQLRHDAIQQYDVVVDNVKVGSVSGTTSYTHEFDVNAKGIHSMRIDDIYSTGMAVEGVVKEFKLNISGIADVEVNDIKLSQGANRLVVEGEGVNRISVYTVAGQKVAEAKGNTVDITRLTTAIYMVLIDTDSGVVSHKINVKR